MGKLMVLCYSIKGIFHTHVISSLGSTITMVEMQKLIKYQLNLTLALNLTIIYNNDWCFPSWCIGVEQGLDPTEHQVDPSSIKWICRASSGSVEH